MGSRGVRCTPCAADVRARAEAVRSAPPSSSPSRARARSCSQGAIPADAASRRRERADEAIKFASAGSALPSAARSRATAHSCRSADGRALAGDERGRGGRAAEEGPRQVQLHHQGQRERANERASERERNRFLGLTSQSSARIGRSCGAAVCGAGALTVSALLSLYRSAWRRKTSSTSPRRGRIRSTRSAHQRRTHGSAGAKAAAASVEQVATAEPHRGHGSFPEWHGPCQGEGCLQGPAGCCGVH